VTWKLIEKKYKKLADEEIESVVQRFKNRNDTEEEIIEEKVITEHEEYKNILKDMSYTPDNDYTVYTEPLKEVVLPSVISPEEYGDLIGYDTKLLVYYSDFVLADEDDNIITDPENIIGDALEHFGDYDDDSVYVRNYSMKCDYEI